jgi:hypothetical protein
MIFIELLYPYSISTFGSKITTPSSILLQIYLLPKLLNIIIKQITESDAETASPRERKCLNT